MLAKRVHASKEAIGLATEIKLRAERKAGEILAATPKAVGGEHGGVAKEDGSRSRPSNPTPTLKEIGVTKDQSSRYQKLAALPAPVFEQVAKGNVPVAVALRPEPSAPPARPTNLFSWPPTCAACWKLKMPVMPSNA